MFLRTRAVLSVFRAAFENRLLRRVGFAYALFAAAEFGIWIALLVYAFERGGPGAGTVMVIVQLVPCIALGPFLGALADRRPPGVVLRVGYWLQALTVGAIALAIGLHAPAATVFALAPLAALSLTVIRPSQAALLPSVVRTADELTAANVMTGWTDGAAALVGPAVVGVLLAVQGLAAAVGAMAAMSALSAGLVLGVNGPTPAPTEAGEDEGGLGAGVHANLRAMLGNRDLRVLLALHTFYFVLIGALDLLCVVLAVDYLHMGAGGPGFLNAALGAGALAAGFVTAFLVGRRHLVNTLTASLTAAVAALAFIGVAPRIALAVVLIAVVGLAGAVFNVTGRTLLQRAAPPDAIAGSFSVLEALMDSGLVLGAVLVRVAIAVGGVKAALVAPAIVAVGLFSLLHRRLRNIDDIATVPQVEIRLLRSITIFEALPAPALETLARQLEPLTVAPGTMVVQEGEPGDCYYAVAGGELAVSRGGRLVHQVSRGDGFGEIALIRDVPRQATVTALTDVSLYSLRKEPFIQGVTGHAATGTATSRLIACHLGEDTPDALDGKSESP